MFGFLGVPVDAAYHLVFALTHLLTPASGGLAAAAAIVLFTAVVRLLISPLSFRALRGQAAMARLAPQVQSLRTGYGRQPERFNREVTALYKREGTSPLSGILPLLAQWPFLSVTYLLFRSATVGGAQNQLLSDGLFGVPLGTHWLPAAGLLSVHDALFLAVFAVLAALCWLSARLAKRAATPAVAPAAGSKTAGLVTLVLPYLTVVIAAFAPLAAAIYLLTTVAWTFAERSIFLRRTARAASAPPARTPVTLVRPARSGTRSHRRGPVR
ncbi:MAG: YidC/Oxa1 family rane protein insertase [Trebonia sp.]|nr:YidC/Oxa1 family rane protein insertase [Trebonia sp.]